MAKELSNLVFDYSAFDADTRGKLIWYAAEIRNHYKRHAEEALAMGKMLGEAQELCGEKPFREWAPVECGCSVRTAYNYISAYAEFGECANSAHIELSAMYELTKNESAKKKALAMAAKGIKVTYTKAKKLIKETSSDKGKPGGASESSLETVPASPGPASGEDADSPGGRAGEPGHGAQTQHQADESRDAHPSARPSKCPNCAGTVWDHDDEGWACSECHEPYREPAGDADDDRGPPVPRQPIETIEVFEDGWVEAFDHFWGQCPGAIKLVIRDRITETTRRGSGFQPPTVSEVRAYCKERDNGIDEATFVDYYESVGWKVGKKPMKDWKASVRTWERKKKESGGKKNWLKDYLNRDKSKDST